MIMDSLKEPANCGRALVVILTWYRCEEAGEEGVDSGSR